MSPRRTQFGSRRGFTLVEVLATLVLVGIVLPVVMRGISVALAAASTARHRTQAAALAEAKLNELVLLGDWTQIGIGSDFGDRLPGYRWTCTSELHEFNTTHLTVTVFWTERGEEHPLSVSTLVYDSASDTATGGAP